MADSFLLGARLHGTLNGASCLSTYLPVVLEPFNGVERLVVRNVEEGVERETESRKNHDPKVRNLAVLWKQSLLYPGVSPVVNLDALAETYFTGIATLEDVAKRTLPPTDRHKDYVRVCDQRDGQRLERIAFLEAGEISPYGFGYGAAAIATATQEAAHEAEFSLMLRDERWQTALTWKGDISTGEYDSARLAIRLDQGRPPRIPLGRQAVLLADGKLKKVRVASFTFENGALYAYLEGRSKKVEHGSRVVLSVDCAEPVDTLLRPRRTYSKMAATDWLSGGAMPPPLAKIALPAELVGS
jgi:hypothetical protein